METSASSGERKLVSAKRGPTERKSVHAWHAYYAGYSESFVESAIRYLETEPDMLVLDPWGGSGTTGAIASRIGTHSLCLDINPVMATFSAAKSEQVLDDAKSIQRFFGSIPHDIANATEHHDDEALLAMFDAETARTLRAIIEAIPFAAYFSDPDDVEGPARSAVRDASQIVAPRYAFCMAVVFATIREISGTQTAANPTWLRAADAKVSRSPEALIADLHRCATRMLADLRAFFHGRNAVAPNYVLAADARDLPIISASVDRVVTSPPYLTRIDYAMSPAPEMAAFGNAPLLDFVRHRTMGAPVITKNSRQQKQEWGKLCNAVLDAVRTHPSKAAESYYWKNIIQYFIDLDASLNQIVRAMKPGAKGLVVVQSSYFKDIEIPLGDIYVEMASLRGLKARIAFREEVKGHLAHVNTKSNVYKKNKVYFEDFVFIEKS